MKRDQILQVLYDLALVTGSETSVRPLVTATLQRLLYHTSTSCGLFFSELAPVADVDGQGMVHVTLYQAIAGGRLRDRVGETLSLPAALFGNGSAQISDPGLLASLFGEDNRYRYGLRLMVNPHDFIFLFAPRHLPSELHLDLVFAPVIGNFDHSLRMCRDNERIMNELREELETRTRLEEQLIKKEKLAVVGQLTSSVNHELRNPLGAISTASYLIRRKMAAGDDSWIAQLAVIERNTERCNSIIDQLLGYTRHARLSLENIDIGALIDVIIKEMDIADSIAVHRPDGGGGQITVEADSELLRRALINVLQNAVQAMQGQRHQASGRVSEITVSTRLTDQRFEIILRDTGPGIRTDELERIFEPLFSTRSFGVGLGMPIVRNIMAQHGGDVEINSSDGEGTSILLWLPLSRIRSPQHGD